MTLQAFLARLSCGAAFACATLSAQAALTFYDSQADFLQATFNPGVDNFESLLDAPLDSPLDRSAGTWSYRATVDGGFFAAGPADDLWLSTNQALPIAFNAFSSNVGAVGGFFFVTDVDGSSLGGESITLTATDASGSLTRTILAPSPTSFFGFASDTGSISGFQLAVVDTGVNNAWATVNDLTLAQSVASVPEPSSVALVLGGLGVVAASVRRRHTLSQRLTAVAL